MQTSLQPLREASTKGRNTEPVCFISLLAPAALPQEQSTLTAFKSAVLAKIEISKQRPVENEPGGRTSPNTTPDNRSEGDHRDEVVERHSKDGDTQNSELPRELLLTRSHHEMSGVNHSLRQTQGPVLKECRVYHTTCTQAECINELNADGSTVSHNEPWDTEDSDGEDWEWEDIDPEEEEE